MNIVFFGSSKFSTIVEKKLIETFGLSLVVTLPDQPSGRNHVLTPNPVKIVADEHHIPVITTEKLTDDVIDKIATYHPYFLVVADYGLIIPKKLLDLPQFAPLNVHHSLLPKFRGTIPAPAAILAGEKITGVTIIKLNTKWDEGDILAQKTYPLDGTETTPFLLEKLNQLGADILIDVLNNYEKITPIPQDNTKTTYNHRLTKQSGYIDMSSPLEIENWKLKIERATRAYYPWPGVWLRYTLNNKPNTVIKLLPQQKIQPEGKKPMSYTDFMNGYTEGKELLETLGLV